MGLRSEKPLVGRWHISSRLTGIATEVGQPPSRFQTIRNRPCRLYFSRLSTRYSHEFGELEIMPKFVHDLRQREIRSSLQHRSTDSANLLLCRQPPQNSRKILAAPWVRRFRDVIGMVHSYRGLLWFVQMLAAWDTPQPSSMLSRSASSACEILGSGGLLTFRLLERLQ